MAENESITKLDELINETCNIVTQVNITPVDKLLKLSELLNNATVIVKESHGSVDVVAKDVDFVNTAAGAIGNEIGALDQPINDYDPQRFGTCLSSFVNASSQRWLSLFNPSMVGLGFIPISNSMFASFNPEDPTIKERQRRQRNVEKDPVGELTCPDSIQKAEQTEETSAILDKIKRKLTQIFSKNEMRPLKYYQVVLDPQDFGKTIDNIFQVSFLVRDRVVEIYEENSEIWLKLLNKNEIEEQPLSDRKQIIMITDMMLWQRLVKKYNIKRAMIDILDRYDGKC